MQTMSVVGINEKTNDLINDFWTTNKLFNQMYIIKHGKNM